MWIYVILSIYYLIFIIIESTFKLKYKKINHVIWIFLLMLPLFLIAAFRAVSVGNDTFTYYRAFLVISQEGLFEDSNSVFEIGFILLVRIVSRLGFDYFGFQVLITFFIYYVFSITIKKYSISPAFSVFVFFTMNMFFDTMNITRAYIAISFLLLSLKYIEEKKPYKFFLYVFFASLFHTSALTFFTLYLFAKINWSYKKLIEIIILGVSVFYLFDLIVSLFINLTGRYSDYLTSQYFIFENNIAIYVSLFVNFAFLFLGLLSRVPYKGVFILPNHNIANDKNIYSQTNTSRLIEKSNIWFSAIIIAFVISVAGLNSTIMSRVGIYFSALYILFIPDILAQIRGEKVRSLVAFSVILGLLLYFYVVLIYRPDWYGVIPYKWFW